MPPHTPGSVRVVYGFAEPADRVFDAWLNTELAGHWLFATPTGQIVGCQIDPRVGGRFAIVDRRDGEDVAHNGEYLEIDRPHRLVFRFGVPKYSTEVSRVTITVAALEKGCELTLVNDDVPAEFVDGTREGWTTLLDALDALLSQTLLRE